MNPVLGWLLAAIFVFLAWRQYGWQGVAFAGTAIVFWLLLQFNRAMRTMRKAADRPVGRNLAASAMQKHKGAGIVAISPKAPIFRKSAAFSIDLSRFWNRRGDLAGRGAGGWSAP